MAPLKKTPPLTSPAVASAGQAPADDTKRGSTSSATAGPVSPKPKNRNPLHGTIFGMTAIRSTLGVPSRSVRNAGNIGVPFHGKDEATVIPKSTVADNTQSIDINMKAPFVSAASAGPSGEKGKVHVADPATVPVAPMSARNTGGIESVASPAANSSPSATSSTFDPYDPNGNPLSHPEVNYFLNIAINEGLGPVIFNRKPMYYDRSKGAIRALLNVIALGGRGRARNPEIEIATTPNWESHPDPLITISNVSNLRKEVALEADTVGLSPDANADEVERVANRLSGQEGLEWMRDNHTRIGTAIGFSSDNAKSFSDLREAGTLNQRKHSDLQITYDEIRGDIKSAGGSLPSPMRHLAGTERAEQVAHREITDALERTDRLRAGHEQHLQQYPDMPYMNSVFIQVMDMLHVTVGRKQDMEV